MEVKFSFGIHAVLCAYGKRSQIWIGVLGWKDLSVELYRDVVSLVCGVSYVIKSPSYS